MRLKVRALYIFSLLEFFTNEESLKTSSRILIQEERCDDCNSDTAVGRRNMMTDLVVKAVKNARNKRIKGGYEVPFQPGTDLT